MLLEIDSYVANIVLLITLCTSVSGKY